MNRPVKPTSRPQQAVQSYLDALLQEATEQLPDDNAEALQHNAQHVAQVADEFEAAVMEEQARDAATLADTPARSPQPQSAPERSSTETSAQLPQPQRDGTDTRAQLPQPQRDGTDTRAQSPQPQRSSADSASRAPARWAEPDPQLTLSTGLLLPSDPPLLDVAEPDLRMALPLAAQPEAALDQMQTQVQAAPLAATEPQSPVTPGAAEAGSRASAPANAVVDLHKSTVSAQVPTLGTDNLQASAGAPPVVGADGRPLWAAEPFECLLFDVAGLTLAVPLVCLGSIYALAGQELTPLFGQPNWFLGILPSLGGNLKVLDTARWVMPDRYRDDFQQGLQYVISVQGYEWGLAVHQVSRSLRLDPQEIKWRANRGQRPWLAGTVIEHMCALLDVAALAELIASGAAKEQEAAAMQAAKAKKAAEVAARPAARAKR